MVSFDRGPKIKKPVNTTFYRLLKKIDQVICGERGIRTLGTVSRTTVFETVTIDRSAISPGRGADGVREGGKSKEFGGKEEGKNNGMGMVSGKSDSFGGKLG